MKTLFYDNPRLLLLTIVLILVAGFSAYMTVPRKEDPSMVSRFALVNTSYPGANAQQVEALVTRKLEDELREMEEIKLMKSTSRASISVIIIELRDTVRNPRAVWARVRDRLSNAEADLPSDADKPELNEEDSKVDAYTIIAALYWDQNTPASYAILKRLAEELEDSLRAVQGTGDSKLFGAPDEEIVVSVDGARLSDYGLSAKALSQRIAAADSKYPAGEMHGTGNAMLLEISGELDSLDRVRSLPVLEGQDGHVVRVADLASVSKGIKEPASELAFVDGKPGISVAVRMLDGQRIDSWSKKIRKEVQRFSTGLPRGIECTILYDQSVYTNARMNGLESNLIQGALFVFLITLLLMGVRSALLVGLALPLSVLMVLSGLGFLGIPLHQISVTGLIVALGLLIDTAIITVHDVQTRAVKTGSGRKAVAESLGHLTVPLLSSTFTTILAFMPMILMPGGIGEFVGSISVSVILALCSSLFVSLVIIAPLAGLLSEHRIGKDSWPLWTRGISFPRLGVWYGRSLRLLFRLPVLGIALALSFPFLGFWGGTRLQEQFFPPSERDQLQIKMTLPSQASLDKTQRTVLEMRQLLLTDADVRQVSWYVGGTFPKFYYNVLGGQNNSPFMGQAMVQLAKGTKPHPVARRLQQKLDRFFPEAQCIVKQLEQGPPVDAPVEFHIFGPDLEILRRLGEQLRGVMARTPDIIHTSVSIKKDRPTIHFTLSEEDARIAGLSNTEIAAQLRNKLDGAEGGSVLEDTEELPVRVRLANDERGRLERIASLELLASGTDGALRSVPLGAVAQAGIAPDFASITHRNGQRCMTVQAYVTAGVLPAKALNAVREELKDTGFVLPPGYHMMVGGESEKRDESVNKLAGSLGLLLVFLLATLVLSFNSFRSAAIIAMVGLLSVGLGQLALFVFGYPFGFMAIIGIMGLVGVAVNDSIVVLATLRENPLARAGDRQAMVRVVTHCTRHVISTSLTTMAGFFPLMVAGGSFWPPLAVSIAGGVLGATLLGLYFTPCAYLLLCGGRLRKKNSAERLASEPPVALDNPQALPL